MTDTEIDFLVKVCAADLLEFLSNILPEQEDEGALGELVLQKALDTYMKVAEMI